MKIDVLKMVKDSVSTIKSSVSESINTAKGLKEEDWVVMGYSTLAVGFSLAIFGNFSILLLGAVIGLMIQDKLQFKS